jgi:hypothetical protein
MACETCTHTMQAIAEQVWWCPRCGTLKFGCVPEREDWTEPKLVHRAFNLCESSLDILADYKAYRRIHGQSDPHLGLGFDQAERAVRECCLPPEDR